MCGIAGLVNYGNSLSTSDAIKKMADVIAHRGPDDEGFFLSSESKDVTAYGQNTPEQIISSGINYTPKASITSFHSEQFNIALAHRRLSILDLSPAGHQPMCNNNKDIWLTFNGEIYNYIEIREELIQLGYTFVTNTDTEVVIASYKQWGTDCVSHFNGMWAFVIYDKKQGLLFASRDRFGVKPFYYYSDKNVFAFASEQKALVKMPFVKTEINTAATFDYFVMGQIEYEEEGMFKNVFELMPSHSFTYTVKDRIFKKWRYYELPISSTSQQFNSKTENEITEELRALLLNSVRLRLRSDVPVGACLSGGIDSSSIVGMMRSILGEKIKIPVFTACFDDKAIDESSWAKKVVDTTNVDWHKVFPTSSELLMDLENLMYCQDVPIWSTSTYAQFRTMQSVKENGVKVIMDGQGGDELFGGYPHHYIYYWRELLKNKQYGKLRSELSSYKSFPSNYAFFIKQYAKHIGMKKMPVAFQSSFNQWHFKEMHYLNKDFLAMHKDRFELAQEKQIDSLNSMLKSEFNSSLLKGYLKCEDRCSMFHSVESRTPFSDDTALVEYALQIPSEYKIKKSVNKYILREAMKPYLPIEVYQRKDKMGYATPNNRWLTEVRVGLKDVFNTSESNNIIDNKRITTESESLFNIYQKPENGRVFKFVSFALWQKLFFTS